MDDASKCIKRFLRSAALVCEAMGQSDLPVALNGLLQAVALAAHNDTTATLALLEDCYEHTEAGMTEAMQEVYDYYTEQVPTGGTG